MGDWQVGTILFWLAVAILLPGTIIHFTLGRKGGHHLFDRDKLSAAQLEGLPLEMVRKRTAWNIKGSIAALLALAAVGTILALSSRFGFSLGSTGLAEDKMVKYGGAIIVLLITLGPAIYRKVKST